MVYASQETAHPAGDDPRGQDAVRFLIRGGLLPSDPDDAFWRRLKVIIQARKLGLSLADVRQLLAADPLSPPATCAGRIVNACTSTTVTS
jgi:DNA-binding transcriptional MerR regulator